MRDHILTLKLLWTKRKIKKYQHNQFATIEKVNMIKYGWRTVLIRCMKAQLPLSPLPAQSTLLLL